MHTSFFLVRRHPNVFLDISGIPPKTLLQYFPRLQQDRPQNTFRHGLAWPGRPRHQNNLDDFRTLPLPQEIQQQILSRTALQIWPA